MRTLCRIIIALLCISISHIQHVRSTRGPPTSTPPTPTASTPAPPTPAPSTVAAPTSRPVTDRLSLWFSYVQRGFESVAASIMGLKRGMMRERERVSSVVDDVRAVEKSQQSLLKLLQHTASDVQAVNASLAHLVSLEPKCAEGWTQYNLNCYHFTQCTDKPSCTVDKAAEQCRANGSMLASPRSAADNSFVSSLATDKITHVFIGGHRRAGGNDWVWADGTPVVNPLWSKWEPNNAGGKQDCMLIWRGVVRNLTDHWDDCTCTEQYNPPGTGYVCQAPASVFTK